MFKEVCAAGAFIENPTKAHYALRSLEGYEKVTSKEIKELAKHPAPELEEVVNLLHQLTLVVLDDMRSSDENRSKLSIFLREIFGPIDYYQTNMESDDLKYGTKKHKFYTSKKVISLLKKGEKPVVIFDHRIPMKVMRKEMMENCFTVDDVRSYLKANLKTCIITKDEDQILKDRGFNACLPSNRDRYGEVNIKLCSEPVYFRKGHSSMKFVNKYA